MTCLQFFASLPLIPEIIIGGYLLKYGNRGGVITKCSVETKDDE
jgi:hypothetical protein